MKKFQDFCENYFEIKMQQYKIVVDEINKVYGETKLDENKESFIIVKRLIINNENASLIYMLIY